MKIQVHLRYPGDSLQIPYPDDFKTTEKSAAERSDTEFHLTTSPRFLSEAEVSVAREFVKALPYTQQVVATGAILIDPNDPLLSKTHDELDTVERSAALGVTRLGSGGAPRSIRERVILIRERSYQGNGSLALPAA